MIGASMNKYINANFELSISSLIKYVLSKWFFVLILSGLFGLISVSYKYVTFVPASVVEPQSGSNSDVTMLDRYNNGQAYMNNEISELYDKAAEMEEYTNNSIYYNLDPTSFAISTATFEIISNNVDRYEINTLYYAYLYEIVNGDYLIDLSDATSISPEYLSELISVVDIQNNSAILMGNAEQTFPLVIAVYGDSIEQSDTILDAIINAMPNISSNLSETINHECVFVAREHSIKREETMRVNHASIEQYITDLYGKINNLANYQKNIPEPEINTNISTATRLSNRTIIKYAFVGFVLGLFFSSGLLVLIYILDDKVSDITRFQNRYNVRDLGQSDGMIIANIKNYQKDDKKILVTGMASNDRATARLNELKSKVSDVKLVEAFDILNDAESRSRLLDSKDVILLEEKTKSKYSDIDEELKILSSMDKNVVGVIII